MKFERRNFHIDQKETPAKKVEKSSFREKFPRLIRRSILVGATAIASYFGKVSYDTYNPKDYTSVGSFNNAFKKAREDGEKNFKWNGKRFTTDLVDKEFSDTYWESKKFLEDYYTSDYFKSKNITSLDSFNIEMSIQGAIINNPRYKELDDKILNEKIGLTQEEFEEWEIMNEKFNSSDDLYKSDEFKQKIDSIKNERILNLTKNLKESTPFTITSMKGKKSEDGAYNTKNKGIFISKAKKEKDNITTSVHELTHKSSRGNYDINMGKWHDLRDRANESVKANVRSFARKYGVEGYRYLSDPTEIDARQNSTRFWLYKKFPGYKANTVFTEEHFSFLMLKYKELPYDIQQLMDLFPDQEMFIYNMNTY